MTQQERPQRTLNATVKTKGEEQDGWKIEVEIPSFESKYPTPLTRVSDELAARLQPGQSYPLILERQNLKRGKDGSKAYDYYYGLVGIADVAPPTAQTIVDKALKQASTPNGGPSFSLPEDTAAARERATNSRTALMQAVALVTGRDYNEEQVIDVATAFDTWLNATSPMPQGTGEDEPPF